jgi:hypothetical protein
MLNVRGTHTFAFDGPLEIDRIISLFEKIKKSADFIEFIRFFLSNMYTNLLISEELITKKILFRTFGEIPMYEFINDLRTEKLKINTNKDTKMYCKGLSKEYQKENKLELYYITKCREFGDDANFISYNKSITFDFTKINCEKKNEQLLFNKTIIDYSSDENDSEYDSEYDEDEQVENKIRWKNDSSENDRKLNANAIGFEYMRR